jgi:hypothetical protein
MGILFSSTLERGPTAPVDGHRRQRRKCRVPPEAAHPPNETGSIPDKSRPPHLRKPRKCRPQITIRDIVSSAQPTKIVHDDLVRTAGRSGLPGYAIRGSPRVSADVHGHCGGVQGAAGLELDEQAPVAGAGNSAWKVRVGPPWSPCTLPWGWRWAKARSPSWMAVRWA